MKSVKNLAVIDRVSAIGSFGPLYEEILASLNMNGQNVNAYSFVAGLGGRDIWEETIERVITKTEEMAANGERCRKPIWIDLKTGDNENE